MAAPLKVGDKIPPVVIDHGFGDEQVRCRCLVPWTSCAQASRGKRRRQTLTVSAQSQHGGDANSSATASRGLRLGDGELGGGSAAALNCELKLSGSMKGFFASCPVFSGSVGTLLAMVAIEPIGHKRIMVRTLPSSA